LDRVLVHTLVSGLTTRNCLGRVFEHHAMNQSIARESRDQYRGLDLDHELSRFRVEADARG